MLTSWPSKDFPELSQQFKESDVLTSPTPSSNALIERLWLKRSHGGVMDDAVEATFLENAGIETSADQGGKRQVTVLATEDWDNACREIGANLDPKLRRANVLVRGIDLENSRGRVLQLGPCQIEIWGETVPCKLMEETAPGLLAALLPKWRGGAFGLVRRGGLARVGDPVRFLPPQS